MEKNSIETCYPYYEIKSSILMYYKEMAEEMDEEVAIRVQGGNAEAFGLLMSRYEKKLLRYGRKFLGDPDDIEILVQDVFIKTYTNIKSFDPHRSFSPWIYRIAHNEFMTAVQKKWRERLLPLDLDILFPHPIAPETADGLAHQKELKKMLDQCLSSIPLKYREVLVLSFYEEMDYKEIAEILKIPISTVGVRLARGKKILKDSVAKTNHHTHA